MNKYKTLFLDIETSPMTVYTWRLLTKWIPPENIVDTGAILCWSAKWADGKKVMHSSVHEVDKHTMLVRIHDLLDEADVVVHYNGTKFDIPILNKEFLEAGMLTPSPYKQVDVLKHVRRLFKFPSNKLSYVAKALDVDGKVEHEGFGLWIKCMAGDKKAWATMKKYNMQDVAVLEAVYETVENWLPVPISKAYSPTKEARCPQCGGTALARRGFHYTAVGKYARYQCSDCGRWSNERTADVGSALR